MNAKNMHSTYEEKLSSDKPIELLYNVIFGMKYHRVVKSKELFSIETCCHIKFVLNQIVALCQLKDIFGNFRLENFHLISINIIIPRF